MSREFERLMDGEPLTEEEQRRMWAQAPVIKLPAKTFDALMEELDREPRELERLAELMREQTPRGDVGI
jgi:hypothetical protein